MWTEKKSFDLVVGLVTIESAVAEGKVKVNLSDETDDKKRRKVLK